MYNETSYRQALHSQSIKSFIEFLHTSVQFSSPPLRSRSPLRLHLLLLDRKLADNERQFDALLLGVK